MGRGRTVSPAERQKRIDFIGELLACCTSTSEICELVQERLHLGRSATEKLIGEVRREWSKIGIEYARPEINYHRRLAVDSLKLALSDARVLKKPGDMIRAADTLAKIFGCYTDRLELTGPGGAPLAIAVETARDRVQKKLENIQQKLTAKKP